MTTAQRITRRMAETKRQRGKDSIYAVVSDEHNVLCLTEAHLDCWWESLSPEDKAALYELHLEGALEAPEVLTVSRCNDPEFQARMRDRFAEFGRISRRMIALHTPLSTEVQR